jgi:hypothetical protein
VSGSVYDFITFDRSMKYCIEAAVPSFNDIPFNIEATIL